MHDNPGGGEPQKTGSVYNFKPRTIQQARPVPKGEWTDYEIKVVGQTYTIIRDGQVITEFENSPGQESSRPGDPPTEERQFLEGFIGLQNHGNSDLIEYRNISVQDLDPEARTGTGPFVVSGNGAHVVEYRANDLAGNVEAKGTLSFRIGPNAQPSPPPGGSPPADPNPPVIDTPASFSLRSAARRAKTRTFARRGLRVRVACTGAMIGSAKLTVSRRTARRLGLRSRTLVSRSVRCWGAHTRTVSLKPSKRVTRRLVRSRRAIATTLQIRMSDDGRTQTASRRVTLRR